MVETILNTLKCLHVSNILCIFALQLRNKGY